MDASACDASGMAAASALKGSEARAAGRAKAHNAEGRMMDSPRLFRIAASDGTRIFGAQGVEFEGRLWIVPEWLEAPDEGWRTPERMICFDDIPHQSFPEGNEL